MLSFFVCLFRQLIWSQECFWNFIGNPQNHGHKQKLYVFVVRVCFGLQRKIIILFFSSVLCCFRIFACTFLALFVCVFVFCWDRYGIGAMVPTQLSVTTILKTHSLIISMSFVFFFCWLFFVFALCFWYFFWFIENVLCGVVLFVMIIFFVMKKVGQMLS